MTTRPFRRSNPLAPLAGFVGLVLWLSAQLAQGADEEVVRVLLMETGEAVHIAGKAAGENGVTVVPGSSGLRVGGRTVGRVWQLVGPPGGGTMRVNDLRVRGDLELRQLGDHIQVVNRLDLEDYVAGTVGREIYPHWDGETLKAQAVVARTYALYQRARSRMRDFDLGSGTASQVYGGVDAETPAVRAATRSTRGEYLAYENQPILAVYHSASGGQTASAEEVWGRPTPYLISLPVAEEEDSPDTYWRASVSGTTLGRALAPLGYAADTVRAIRIAERSASGRALVLSVRGEAGEKEVDAGALRRVLGANRIRSTLFEIRTDGDRFVFVGSGHGHGVGMSQWGAQAMAKRGASYREILEMFYPGTALVEGPGR